MHVLLDESAKNCLNNSMLQLLLVLDLFPQLIDQALATLDFVPQAAYRSNLEYTFVILIISYEVQVFEVKNDEMSKVHSNLDVRAEIHRE
jgi:hypothetical protein